MMDVVVLRLKSDVLKSFPRQSSGRSDSGVRTLTRSRCVSLAAALSTAVFSVITVSATAQLNLFTVSPTSCALYCESGATTQTVFTITSTAGPTRAIGMSVYTKDDSTPQVQNVMGELDENLATNLAFCGNYYHCTSPRRLDSFETWVDVTATTLLQSAIFYATQLEGPYKMICSYGRTTGPMSGFVSWPGVNLNPSSYYLIGTVVKSPNTVGYTNSGTFPQTLPFGEAIAGHVVSASSIPTYEPATAMAYQRLNTSPEWLTTSVYPGIASLRGGQSTTMTVTANASGLTGTHYGEILIGDVSVPVTLVVSAPASPPDNPPDPVAGPDLSAQVISLKLNCKTARCAAKLRLALSNNSDIIATRTRCSIYLSSDATLDDSDAQIGSLSFGSVRPKSSITNCKTLRLPPNLTDQYLVCVLDAYNPVDGSTKSNYTITVPLH